MKYFFLLLAVLSAIHSLRAQTGWCANELDQLSASEWQQALAFYERDRPPLAKNKAVDSVAVSIHIVEAVAGAANITFAELEREIDRVNAAFGAAGIAFFICGSPRFIRGRGSYTATEASNQLNASYHIPNTINIFFVDEIAGAQDGFVILGRSAFPWDGRPADRFLIMRKSASTDGATLTHELGHFYGLLHTHETARGREYVDGSNCTRAGDLLCDTPADPNLGQSGMMRGCAYIGNVTDPRGRSYKPQVSNYMSYAPANCQRLFSTDQFEVMRSVHEDENAYLTNNCDFYPDFAISTATDQVNIRSDQDLAIEYNFQNIGVDQAYEIEISVSIADTPEEDGFILLRDKLRIQPGQSAFSQTFDIDFPISRGTGIYYLKTFLDSAYKVIERTERNNFATTTIRVDNSSLSDVLLFPNPVDDELKLFFRDRRAEGRMYIRIYRYDGRLVLEDEVFKNDEEFFKVLDVSWLSTGLYVIAVDFEKVNREYSFKFLKK